ncbi:uncharacterized protein BJX67DRAFT_157907 [Aspergillus lucknowensis]|uniref:Lysozyme-like domain-containing protein n=1 Tax=Aspergillus lucknowensis TaxID=176173 RepID=A0ABR4M3Y0_9EURO
MRFLLQLLPLLPLALGATTSPCTPQEITITPSQILFIAPNSTSCANAPELAKGECVTAAQAAPPLSAAFTKYKVTSRAEQAAVLALIAFESGEFRYNRNHFPGVPGQGTRNMQSPTFNKEYAASIPALEGRFQSVKDDPAAVLDLLLEDAENDFGSGAWFLTTQCADAVRRGLQSGTEQGWRGFIVDCVGTEANEARKGYWVSAVNALQVSE